MLFFYRRSCFHDGFKSQGRTIGLLYIVRVKSNKIHFPLQYVANYYYKLLICNFFFASFAGFRLFPPDSVPTISAFLPGLHASNPGRRPTGWFACGGGRHYGGFWERQLWHVCNHWQVRVIIPACMYIHTIVRKWKYTSSDVQSINYYKCCKSSVLNLE